MEDGGSDVIITDRSVVEDVVFPGVNGRIRSEYQLFITPKRPESTQQNRKGNVLI